MKYCGNCGNTMERGDDLIDYDEELCNECYIERDRQEYEDFERDHSVGRFF